VMETTNGLPDTAGGLCYLSPKSTMHPGVYLIF
jgi:hypothetical protein